MPRFAGSHTSVAEDDEGRADDLVDHVVRDIVASAKVPRSAVWSPTH